MKLLNSLLTIGQTPQRKSAIVRVSYGRLGQLLTASIKASSGDPNVDARALEHISKQPHPTLHHPGKNKKRRLDQWYDIRYFEN